MLSSAQHCMDGACAMHVCKELHVLACAVTASWVPAGGVGDCRWMPGVSLSDKQPGFIKRCADGLAGCGAQPSKDCVQKTLKRLEDKIQGKVLNQVLYSMTCPDRLLQQRTATALARLAREQDLKTVFVDRHGLDILLSLLTDAAREPAQQREAAGAVPRGCGSGFEVCTLGFGSEFGVTIGGGLDTLLLCDAARERALQWDAVAQCLESV